jgi:DUF1680 family protein
MFEQAQFSLRAFILALSFTVSAFFQETVARQNPVLRTFDFHDVTLLPGLFREAETTDLNYILAMKPDRLLAPYLREAGLPPKAESYGNWENTGLDGHIGGHYLSALAMMSAATGNKEVAVRLDYMLSELKRCQDKNGNGYVGGVPGSAELWNAVMKGNVDAIGRKWVPLYNLHKTFAGIRDAYLFTGNPVARQMLISFAGWFANLSSVLGEQKMQTLLRTEHGGINEVLADVYALTGDKKYLDAAYSFSHRAILEPLENGEDRLNNLHANTQIPKVIGFERISEVHADSAYHKAAKFFWETVVTHRTVAIGGNSVREHFHPSTDFSSMISSEQGPETCNTYNMLRLTTLLFKTEPLARYIDYYERALYNHILSSQHPRTGGFVYFTPMRPGHYRVYSQPETSMWCCVGSGMENHAKYSELIYAHSDNDLYVNLFIPSRLNWKEKGVTLTQQTGFPDSETTNLTLNAVRSGDFTLHVRYPVWVNRGALKISVNGEPFAVKGEPSSFVAIRRVWKEGDRVAITLPMHTSAERLPDGSDYVAVLHGPVVLAAKTGSDGLTGLFANDSRMGHVANGLQIPLQDMPVFVSANGDITSEIHPVPGKPLTFTTGNLVYPAAYAKVELIPFFRLHDSRYVIYWPEVTPGKLNEIRHKTAEAEAEKQKLAALTIDVVYAGEQQPEADHFIESENSATGVTQGRHWRDARGWFSYKLSDKNNQADRLRITYFGQDRGRHFSILINDQQVADVTLENRGSGFYTIDYPVPAAIRESANGSLSVKFVPAARSVAGGIYEVRLLKK